MISKAEALDVLKGSSLPQKSLLTDLKKRYSPYVTYSKNVFVPLTHACRNKCGYCVFRQDTVPGKSIMPLRDAKGLIAKAEEMGCSEVLFTFGERAEEIDHVACELDGMGYATMVDYLIDVAAYVSRNTRMFAHSNPGILRRSELEGLREVNASLGLMLESSSARLMETPAHKHSPGKEPKLRIRTIKDAGRLHIPFTTGVLLGIGETEKEIVDSLFEIRRLHDTYGHIQEIIIQNFIPKKGTPMEDFPPAPVELLERTLALSRILFPDIALQIPPNLNAGRLETLMRCGLDDLGGISPITPDYVNPENSWPDEKTLFPGIRWRLPVYPRFISRDFLSEHIYEKAKSAVGRDGYVRRNNYV